MNTLTPYEEASQLMKNDPTLKHVIYAYQDKFDKCEKSRGFFRFRDDASFNQFVDDITRRGVTYIAAVHR